MPYDYADQKITVSSDDGQRMLLQIKDRVAVLILTSGAARMEEIIRDSSGDSWMMLACVDRLVELGLLREVTGHGVIGQHRVFVKGTP